MKDLNTGIYTALILISLSFMACTSKSSTDNPIVGKWGFQEMSEEVSTSDPETSLEVKNYLEPYRMAAGNADSFIEFTADGKAIMQEGSRSATTGYTTSGGILTRSSEGRVIKNKFTLTGDTLWIVNDLTEHVNTALRQEMRIEPEAKIKYVAIIYRFVRK